MKKEMPMTAAAKKMNIAKHKLRPNVYAYIENIFSDFIELRGDRYFGDDQAVCGGIARFSGLPVTVIGHFKGNTTKENIRANFGMAHPEGYRKSLRLMKQAEKFKRPIICFVDTPGAFCGPDAEERGQGEAIARNLYEMSSLRTPIISIVTGEGGSGGALALAVGDIVLMAENSIYSVISPKGFASILWKEPERELEAAEIMKITAKDLLRLRVIDRIIDEPPDGAHTNIELMCKNIKNAVSDALNELMKMTGDELVCRRWEKYSSMGVFKEAESL